MFKKIFLFSLGLAFLSSCETKFSVNGEYVETPIVHFLLDQGKEIQYLKLNRTFLKEGNANEFAKQPELSYFDNVDATVEEIKDGVTLRTWTLKDTVIKNKKEGAFYAPEQKLYFFRPDFVEISGTDTTYLDEDAFYRLKIDIDNGNHMVNGQTNLVSGVNITYPKPQISFNFAESDVSSNGYRSTPISFSRSPEAGIFNLKIRFDYNEFIGSNYEKKSLLWPVGEITNSGTSTSGATIFAEGEQFYKYLQNNIDENPAVTKRQIEGIEIQLVGGSKDLYTYMLTNEPSSSLAQNKPTYSNVDGALGIFSSRVTVTQYKDAFFGVNSRALNENSTKELCNGQFTAPLKFCSHLASDVNTNFSCN
ncbi:DUF4249 family protein [Brumimicrobium oceani]|nr:DUF4249 family protein [Brumimicrobium oceani]